MEKSPKPFLKGFSTQYSGVPLLSACLLMHAVWRLRLELEVCVQSQGSDLVATMEMWLDGSHDWSLAKKSYKLLRKDRLGRGRLGVVLYVRE